MLILLGFSVTFDLTNHDILCMAERRLGATMAVVLPKEKVSIFLVLVPALGKQMELFHLPIIYCQVIIILLHDIYALE